ncbi:hypothetical protein [Cryobacterium fucosi]|uniref:Uncharacterized protein n=1 Tax=Cryobacterium fucosi TaxID=1259157 RepID=A0A4R9B505_9MICO|nr:hypothetical protein [Cryobacterium fucosi]TFD74717.1 hypothetical protein E3T48_12385 [Cryobacterium fucosi]
MSEREELIKATHQWLDTGGIHPAYAAVVRTLLAALESPPAAEEQEHCGLGSCAATGGHEGTCAEASGWDVEGEPEREALITELRECGAGDIRFGISDIADAILAAGYRREPEPREVSTVEELDAKTLLAQVWDDGFTEHVRQETMQRADPSHPITRVNPYLNLKAGES